MTSAAASRPRLGVSKSYQITNVFPTSPSLENVRVAVQSYRYSFNFWSRASDLAGGDKAAGILREVALAEKRSCWPPISPRGEAPPRAGHRARHRAEPAPARRAHRGHEPRGDGRDDPADPSDRRRAHGHPRRAQDEGGHEHLGQDHRAPPGPGARRGFARRDPRQCPRPADLSRGEQATAGPLLAIQDLHAYYGEAHILQGVLLLHVPARW